MAGSPRSTSTPIKAMMADAQQADAQIAAKQKLLTHLDEWVASGLISASRKEDLKKMVAAQVSAHNNDPDDLDW